MAKILSVTSFKSNNGEASIISDKNKNKPKHEYPMTYNEYKKDFIISRSLTGLFLGGITGGLIKIKHSAKASVIGGAAMAGFCLVSVASTLYTGKIKVNYLLAKHKFENLANNKN